MFREFHDTDIAAHTHSRDIVALLALYKEFAPQGGAVDFEPFFELANERFGRYLVTLSADDGTYRVLSRGPATAIFSDIEIVGTTLEVLPGDLGAFLDELYTRVFATDRPVFAVHRAVRARHVHLWERIVVPARTADGEKRLFDLSLPREYQADLLSAVLEASCDGILSVRAMRAPDGTLTDAAVVAANGQAARCLGVALPQLTDGPIRAILKNLSLQDAWERCARALEERRTERFEASCLLDGMDTMLRITATPLGDGLMLSFTDITDLRYALIEMEVSKEEAERARLELVTEISARRMVEGELRRIATTDGLTGVLNRRGFEERMEREAGTARRYGYPLAIIGIDIDHFKRVNDLHGHAAGDMVLMTVAAMFTEEVRVDSDSVGRVGGEEFMVLLPHTDAVGAALLADRLREKLMALPIVVGETTLSVTASFGVSELRASGGAEQTAIEADDALYRAKRGGRNRVVVFTGERAGEAHEALPGA